MKNTTSTCILTYFTSDFYILHITIYVCFYVNFKKTPLAFTGLIELKQLNRELESKIQYSNSQLTRQVKRRDRLRHRRERQYNLVTAILQASSQKRSKTLDVIGVESSSEVAIEYDFYTNFCKNSKTLKAI